MTSRYVSIGVLRFLCASFVFILCAHHCSTTLVNNTNGILGFDTAALGDLHGRRQSHRKDAPREGYTQPSIGRRGLVIVTAGAVRRTHA